MGHDPQVPVRGKEYRLRAEAWRVGRRDLSRVVEKNQGPAVHRLRTRVPRAVLDGEGRRNCYRLRREDGPGTVPGASGCGWQILRLPGGGQREYLFHVPG